jgi:hypothetical protein
VEVGLIASQLCWVNNQSRFSIEAPIIEPHLQTSGGRAKYRHPGAVAKAVNWINIPKGHHRSTNLELENRLRMEVVKADFFG